MIRVQHLAALLMLVTAFTSGAVADEAATAAAQQTVERQLEAFLSGDDEAAYSHAAPNIKRMYPTRDAFMAMVRNLYAPVHRPQNYAFGKSEMQAPGRIKQSVLLLGPDGKDYEAVYTLELQEDGIFRITGVSLRASNIPSI